jgi:hypothetical protein
MTLFLCRPETPLSLYKQAVRLVRQQQCGDVTADAATEKKLCKAVELLQTKQQEQPEAQTGCCMARAPKGRLTLGWPLGVHSSKRCQAAPARHLRAVNKANSTAANPLVMLMLVGGHKAFRGTPY